MGISENENRYSSGIWSIVLSNVENGNKIAGKSWSDSLKLSKGERVY